MNIRKVIISSIVRAIFYRNTKKIINENQQKEKRNNSMLRVVKYFNYDARFFQNLNEYDFMLMQA